MSFKKLLSAGLIWLLAASCAFAQVSMTGAGVAKPNAAATYQGPGDVLASAYAWYSCARTYSSAVSAGTSMCDLVATTGGAAVCTIVSAANGFADQSAYCPGSLTPSAACAAASGGSCRITQVYDQTGNARHVSQATLGSMPNAVFSSTPTGTLPAIGCTNSGANRYLFSANVTLAQPIALSIVQIRNSGTGANGISSNGSPNLGNTVGAANSFTVTAGTALSDATNSADATWHAVQGLANGNGTASAINVDGNDTTGAAGLGTWSAVPIRLCLANSNTSPGNLAEAGVWGTATTATDRNNLNANQHGANGYNF